MNSDADEDLAELRQELCAMGVQPYEPVPEPGQAERSELALARIVAGSTHEPPSANRESRWALKGAVVAAAAVAIVAISFSISPSTRSRVYAATPHVLDIHGSEQGYVPEQGRSARQLLIQLSEVARTQGRPDERPVQYIVTASWNSSMQTRIDDLEPAPLIAVERESFFESDGWLRTIEKDGRSIDTNGFLEAAADSEILSTHSTLNKHPGPQYADKLAEQTVTVDQLSNIPGGDECHDTSAVCLMHSVASMNQTYVVPPALDAALLRLLSSNPDITYLGRADDRLGRPAEVFSARSADGASQHLLLIDPATGNYVGDETLTRTSAAPEASVASFTTLVTAKRLSEAPDQ